MGRYLIRDPKFLVYVGVLSGVELIIYLLATALDTWIDPMVTNTNFHDGALFIMIVFFILLVNHFFVSRIYSDYAAKEELLGEGVKDLTKDEVDKALKKFKKPKSVTYPRFEDLYNSKELTYGIIKYKPFFWKEGFSKPCGIGYDLLSHIISDFPNTKLEQVEYPGRQNGNNWTNAFDDLCSRRFDIIITPLFETRTRLYDYSVMTTSPLFFSNIGIYMKRSSFKLKNRLNYDEALEYLNDKKKKGWKAEYIPGELSEALVKKNDFLKHSALKEQDHPLPASDENFAKVLQNVNQTGGDAGDFVFMEVFKANMIMNEEPERFDLVNILKDNQLLYPVSFYVRKEEVALKNLLNLKIIEMRRSGTLAQIIHDAAIAAGLSERQFPQIFVQSYDVASLCD